MTAIPINKRFFNLDSIISLLKEKPEINVEEWSICVDKELRNSILLNHNTVFALTKLRYVRILFEYIGNDIYKMTFSEIKGIDGITNTTYRC